MYKIEPFTKDFDVKPNFQFYRIEPMHKSFQNSSAKTAVKQQDTSANMSLEAKQQALIKSLELFNIKVDKYINEFGKQAEKKTDKNQQKQPEKKKTEKNQPMSQQKPRQTSVENTSDLTQLSISPIKSTARVVYTGLNAKLYPFGYETKDFSVTLQCEEKDRAWLEVLKKLGQQVGIEIDANPSGNRAVKVEIVQSSRSVQLSSALFVTVVRGRIAVWKTLGVLFGLFDFSDAPIVGSIQEWLRIADDLLEERQKLDEIVRKACQRLSSHDFLAANDIPSLADYIVHSLISDAAYLPNNVELWAKRVQI